ncbi:copper chaperone PCu(A)C [Parvibaculum sp.]|uniref:copper chaperone PCu(A)C n=1 Tax=Parvibaculum sp. TaxID=2024848 RepID=UPI003297C604
MIRPFRLSVATLLLVAPLLASCGEAGNSEIAIADPWARASVTETGAAYLTVSNAGNKDDVLLEARSPVAGKVEIHDMTMEGMVMKMRRLDALPVPAGGSVALAPGGKHIMLIGLAEPLSEGMSVPLTLVFEGAGEVEVSAPVRPAGQAVH